MAIEADVVQNLAVENSVIATGGSVVYNDLAMKHLKSQGMVFYLKLPFDAIARRIDNMASRGIAKRAGQSLSDLYRERTSLYEHYADVLVDCTGLDIEGAVNQEQMLLKNSQPKMPYTVLPFQRQLQ